MKTHIFQHWVPKSYLKAWADPNPTAGNIGKVSRAQRDGREMGLVGTRKIFGRNDTYTIRGDDVERDLSLEESLGNFEREFSRIRTETLR